MVDIIGGTIFQVVWGLTPSLHSTCVYVFERVRHAGWIETESLEPLGSLNPVSQTKA